MGIVNCFLIMAFVLGAVTAQSKISDIGQNKKSPHRPRYPQYSYTIEQFYTDSLQLHNNFRSIHGSGPLTLDKTLCRNAQKWANKLASEDKFVHQTNSPYGENLYSMWSSVPIVVRAEDAFFSWYNEGKNYNYTREPKSQKAGHFTQVVWKNSKYLGVGIAKNKNTGKTVIVATYYPPGNYRGQFTKNVLKPQ